MPDFPVAKKWHCWPAATPCRPRFAGADHAGADHDLSEPRSHSTNRKAVEPLSDQIAQRMGNPTRIARITQNLGTAFDKPICRNSINPPSELMAPP